MWKIHGFPTKMIYTWWVSISIYIYIYISLQEGNEWVLLYLDLTGFLTTGVLEAIQVAYPNKTVQNEPR